MSLNSLITSVQSYLISCHMHADNEWLSGCVEFLTEDSRNNYSTSDIQNLAKQQWLLNDLKDICPGSLPVNLKNQPKTVLNGRFVLQINAAFDIGTPAYQQYLKLQKVNTENIEATTHFDDKVPSHRMLKLYLTDGVQEVSAIEYKPMRNLTCDITPGYKVLIKGPVECRRGVLLLTESAIELLGGEVQEIAISNSQAGLLSAKLGLPITQEPDHNTTINHPRNQNIPIPHTQMPSSRPDADEPMEAYDQTARPVAIVASLQVSNFADDDIDINQLDEIEALFDVKRPSNDMNTRSTNIGAQENPGKRSLGDTHTKPEKKLKVDSKNTTDDYPEDDDLIYEDDDLIFEDDDDLRELEATFDAQDSDRGPILVSSEPFVYIKQITDMRESDRAGRVFRVKGQILKLLSKISVGKDEWNLKCTIVDGTASIDVAFTSGVLSKLVGFTPQEMNQLKKEMTSKPDLKEKVLSALQKGMETLQVLYCIIELTMLEVPKITCLIPFEDEHVCLLEKRMQKSGLYIA